MRLLNLLLDNDCEIHLEPFNEQFSEAYRILRNREDNRSYFFNNVLISKEQQAKWYRKYLKDDSQKMYAIIANDTNVFLGAIGFYDYDDSEGTAEVGRIIVDKEIAVGRGYGAIAINKLLMIMNSDYGINYAYAYIFRDNIASIKSFFKAGFYLDENYIGDNKVKMIWKK